MKAVVIKRGREKSLLRRHPWIFTGAIARIEGSPSAGETVDVLLADGSRLARGAFSPQSQIAVRVWTFDPDEEVSADFFRDRLVRALGLRGVSARPDDPGAARLVNAESDGLPGIIVDRYGSWLVIQILTAGAERWRESIAAELMQLVPAAGLFERSDIDVREKEGLEKRAGLVAGREPPELVEIVERGCRYLVDVRRGHKTGFYLDQSENRPAVAEFARNAEMLNCFSYTGAFGVAALAAGAQRVTNIDSSSAALELSRRIAALNGFDAASVEHDEGDVFSILRRYHEAGRSFDLAVLDPPKFAESRGQLPRASRGYKDINRLAMMLLRPRGTLFTFSCSGLMPPDLFQKIVADAALDAGREAQIIRRLSQAADHPVALPFPEGAYLKGFVCRVTR
jgi:23S rRNA (cytosine1962-C5)-methyltransferase